MPRPGAPTLVCDVDNTICDTRPRVRRCLEAIGRGEVFAAGSRRYGGFKAFLSPEELERFFRVFLSERFLALDEPLAGAAETLHAWTREGRVLVYLTGRHDAPGDSMRAGTLRWLEEHGFPVPNGVDVRLMMKPRRPMQDIAHKRAALARLGAEGLDLQVGLGDLPQEGPLYAAFGLRPILIRQLGLFGEEELRTAPGIVVAEDWRQVRAALGLAGPV